MATCFHPPLTASYVPAGMGCVVGALRQLVMWSVAACASCVPLGSMSKPYPVTVIVGSSAGISSRCWIGVTEKGVGAASAPAGMTRVMRPCESVTLPPGEGRAGHRVRVHRHDVDDAEVDGRCRGAGRPRASDAQVAGRVDVDDLVVRRAPAAAPTSGRW